MPGWGGGDCGPRGLSRIPEGVTGCRGSRAPAEGAEARGRRRGPALRRTPQPLASRTLSGPRPVQGTRGVFREAAAGSPPAGAAWDQGRPPGELERQASRPAPTQGESGGGRGEGPPPPHRSTRASQRAAPTHGSCSCCNSR